MLFLDHQHLQSYSSCVNKAATQNDPYHKALFYTLGLTAETRNHLHTLYDFQEKGICFDGLSAPWQTGTSIRVTRLAFNLYSGFDGFVEDGKVEDPVLYTPYHLFDTEMMPYFWEALKIRYPASLR